MADHLGTNGLRGLPRGPGASPDGVYDLRAAFERMRGAYADTTIDGYTRDFSLFVEWCRTEELAAIPVHPDTLERYLLEHIERLAAVTLERRLFAISRVHRLFDLPNPAQTETVRLALRRIKRVRPCRPRQAKGINRQLREKMLAACSDNLSGLRDKALVALGFEGLCRRAEIAALEVRDFVESDDGSPGLLVRRGKADQDGQGRLVLLSPRTAEIVEDWIAAAELESGPLFRPVYHNKTVRRHMSGFSVSRILKRIARKAGLSEETVGDISGHSLRVGGAQTLLMDGHDVIRLMKIGGWRSATTVFRYIERAELRVWS